LRHNGIIGCDAVTIALGLERLLKDKIAISMIGNHDVLVARLGSNREVASVVGVEPAEGHNGYNDKLRWSDGLRWGDRWKQWNRWRRLGLGGSDVLPLLGEMPHDGLICVRAVPCGIGVCETVKGVTIPCPDGIEPSLLDRET
jgi:hypothetical protein